MIQLTRTGLIADRDEVAALRAQFDRASFVHLEGLLEPYLLATIGEGIEQGPWTEFVHDGVGAEEILSHPIAVPLLRFLTAWPETLHLADDLTGCGPFTWFDGRVYRMTAESGHYDSWHSDEGNGLVAMSLNLSPRGYRGGVFQMRPRSSDALLVEIANTKPGDATLFRISHDLVHRVTAVEAGAPKIAFAGWFGSDATGLLDRMTEARMPG